MISSAGLLGINFGVFMTFVNVKTKLGPVSNSVFLMVNEAHLPDGRR
jgi:hypothetical protein